MIDQMRVETGSTIRGIIEKAIREAYAAQLRR